MTIGRSASMDFFAISKIAGETMGSATLFFFILVFTIEQLSSLGALARLDVLPP